MNRLFTKILLGVFAVFLFTGVSFAGSLSLKVQQPKSPTNLNDFNITFVSLDYQNKPITVKCFKKSPSDAGFSQFGSDINLSNGGNTDSCHVTSSVVNGNGTWQFKVEASTDAETLSQTVNVDYNNSTPGTPSYNGKDKISDCVYRIKFKTADDSGKTVKVEVYRSQSTSFTADSGSKVGQVNLGSDQDGQYDDTVINCSSTYFYAVRAFDSIGNGSGVVGDTSTVTVVTNPSPSPSRGAIQVAQGQGQVLGEETTSIEVTPTTVGKTTGQTQGETGGASSEPTKDVLGTQSVLDNNKLLLFGFGAGVIIILCILVFYFYRRLKQQ